jgi:predicted acylesterase/phospholipase RssA
MYELGALLALEEAVDGLDVNDLWSYVGVSAGSFIAACLANGLTTRQMLRAMLSRDSDVNPLRPNTFFKPAYRDFLKRGVMLPRLGVEAVRQLARQPSQQGVGEAIALLAQALPIGLFDNEPMRRYLRDIFSMQGRTDDFRLLKRRLTVVAADLEAGKSIRFGAPGWDHVSISRAVQASTALPGLYPPVEVEGRHCVDGVLLKTVHASVALQQGAELLFCINPIVPVDVSGGVRSGRLPPNALVAAGLPAVLSQTFRTLIHSRLRVGLSRYASRFPDADIVMLEPHEHEYEIFFANIFSFRSRRWICERGYQSTRRDLLQRFDVLAPILAARGYELRHDVLTDGSRHLWAAVGLPAPHRRTLSVTTKLDAALRQLEFQEGQSC